MARENEAVLRFVKQLNAAFGSRMSADARDLYYQELCKWDLDGRVWQSALALITAREDLERAPTLARVYDYLREALESHEGRPTLVSRELKQAMNAEEIEESKRAGIKTYVDGVEPWFAKTIVLTKGRRSSMLKRELDPLELQAREWAQVASESEIADARAQAYEIMLALFSRVQAPADLAPMLAQAQAAPADYDDSELALGKRRAAQLDRLAQYESDRKFDLSDV